MRLGIIRDIERIGQHIIVLVLDDGGEEPVRIPAEGRPTLAALQDGFGNVMEAVGRAVAYETDDRGMLVMFEITELVPERA